MTSAPDTDTMSAECEVAQRPDYRNLHGECRRTEDVPLPHATGIMLVHRCTCSCHGAGRARGALVGTLRIGTMAVMATHPLTVGFDLDMTLIDSRPGIRAAYQALSAETGIYIDADLAVTRLGPPLELELAHWFPAARIQEMGDRYRAIYPEYAITPSPRHDGRARSCRGGSGGRRPGRRRHR